MADDEQRRAEANAEIDAALAQDAERFAALDAKEAELLEREAIRNEPPPLPPPVQLAPERSPIAESLRDFLARIRKLPEPGWFVRDLLPDEGIVVWHGRPRSMKSLCAVETCLSLSLGEHALGIPRFGVPAGAGVLYLTEEDPDRIVGFRLRLMLAARGILEGQEPEGFRLKIRPGWDLEHIEGQEYLLNTIAETEKAMSLPLRVLTIDPARASMPGMDGSPKDAAAARGFLLRILRETSIRTILIPHHDVKPARDSKDDRGRPERASGGVTFSMGDCMVNFERLNDRECLAVPAAYKVGSDPAPFRVRFESETPAGQGFRGFLRAVAETSTEGESDRERQQVLAYVREHPWLATRDVDRGAGTRSGETIHHLAALEAAGMIVRITGMEAKEKGRSFNATLWGPAEAMPEKPAQGEFQATDEDVPY